MAQIWDGTRLEKLRGRTTQTDLASQLRRRGFGTTQTTVSRWESGQVPHMSVMPALASELGVTVDELFATDDAEEDRLPSAPLDLHLLEQVYLAVGAALALEKAQVRA